MHYSGVQYTKTNTDRVWSRRCHYFYAADRQQPASPSRRKMVVCSSLSQRHPNTLAAFSPWGSISEVSEWVTLPEQSQRVYWNQDWQQEAAASHLSHAPSVKPSELPAVTWPQVFWFFFTTFCSFFSSPYYCAYHFPCIACLLGWEPPPPKYLSQSFNQPLREDERLSWLAVSCILAFHSTQENISRVASNMVPLTGFVSCNNKIEYSWNN